jgi:hypothetical protein
MNTGTFGDRRQRPRRPRSQKGSMQPNSEPTIPPSASKSARTRRTKADAKRQWTEHWKSAITAHHLRRMLRRRDVLAGQKFYDSISSRNTTATLCSAITYGTLRIKLLSIPLQTSTHTILQPRIVMPKKL